jgi:hypothetical protein
MPTPKKYESAAQKQKAYREREKEARLQELQQKGLPATPTIPTMPSSARWRAMETQSLAVLLSVAEEMRAYFEERRESWQESDRGEEFSARLDAIEEVCSSLEALQD